MYRNPGMAEVRDLLKTGGLDALLAKVGKQPEVQAQLQNQLQNMRLTMEKLSPEAISTALRAALGWVMWMVLKVQQDYDRLD
jgi:hypothetical protein